MGQEEKEELRGGGGGGGAGARRGGGGSETEIGKVETRELKERMGLELGGWGWINRQQEIKTGLRDGVGTEERSVVGVIGEERRSIVKKKKKKKKTTTIKRKEGCLGGRRADAGNRGDKGCEGSVYMSVCMCECGHNCRSLC